MPVESEVAAFSGSADTGAKKASAAMVIQEAYRMYRHRQLVKVCMPIPLCSAFLLPSLPSVTCMGITAALYATAQFCTVA